MDTFRILTKVFIYELTLAGLYKVFVREDIKNILMGGSLDLNAETVHVPP